VTAVARQATEPSTAPARPAPSAVHRWLPLAAGLSYFASVLVATGTSPLDVARYAGYVFLALIVPGTLVYRALRRRPHTLVEDVAMGAAVGLVLELPAWALFAALDLGGWLWLWPLAVIVPFGAVPALRRHWVVRDYSRRAPIGWSWSVTGAVAFFTTYLAYTFLERNPILPTSEGTRQYMDLAYQLALAGEAKHQFPLHVPQVAGEPLNYHWFGYAHMASTSMIGHIDLPVVALRLAVPGLCAAAIVLTAVLGWRVSGRPYVGAGAAALFFVIGETNFTHPVTMPFGTQASFVIWHGMSMIYSWVLLIALIAALADVVDRRADRAVPPIGPGAFVLTALLMFASSGAKASSVPVVAIALALTAIVLLIARRRIPWAVVVAGAIAGSAQLFATAVLFRFQAYGIEVGWLSGFEAYWTQPADRPQWVQSLVVVAVIAAFVINMQLRVAGVAPLLWLRRGRLEPVQLLLLTGAIAGPLLYLALRQPGGANQYFTRAGFAFAVVISAWGYALVLERARLDRREKATLGALAAALAVVLTAVELRYAGPSPAVVTAFDPLKPLLEWFAGLLAVGLLAALAWGPASRAMPALRGRGGLAALTALLVIGAPGLVMDMYKSVQSPNGGAYVNVPMPRTRIEAARWTREHSSPRDVIATNVHCLQVVNGWCDARSFWLSAYSERRVLVEGWGFAPLVAALGSYTPFWDQDLLRRNDAAFVTPSADGLRDLRDRYGVRWLVVDRTVGVEAPELRTLARLRFDGGRMAVYELA
jgi:hypothetical protein